MKRKPKFLKWLVITVSVLIVFAVIGRKAGWFGGKEKIQVTSEEVAARSITEIVSASGKIQPETQVKISPDVSGEIVELRVKEGDHVTKGQLLLRILPDIYQSYVDKADAAVNSSRANLENARSREVQAKAQFARAKANYDRNKQLFDEKLISANEWEQVKSAYEVAAAEVDAAKQATNAAVYGVRSAEASLKESNDNLRKTSIFAPVDGTVSKLNVELGERVVGTSQMAGTEMLILADLKEMEVNVDVNENDIVRVNTGDTANIEVDAYLGKKFKGVVTEVASSANITGTSAEQVTNFVVKVRILRESYESLVDTLHADRNVFHPGMSATVDIMTRKVKGAVSVPIQSVTTRDTTVKVAVSESAKSESDGTGTATQPAEEKKEVECVFVLENGKVEFRPVVTGIQDNTYIQIISGLKSGEKIVSGPYSAISRTLKAGDEVEIVSKDELYNGRGR